MPKIELLVKYCSEFQEVFILKILSIIVLLLFVVAYFIFAIFSNSKKIKEYVSKFSSLLFMYKFDFFFHLQSKIIIPSLVEIVFFCIKIICTFYLFNNYCFLL